MGHIKDAYGSSDVGIFGEAVRTLYLTKQMVFQNARTYVSLSGHEDRRLRWRDGRDGPWCPFPSEAEVVDSFFRRHFDWAKSNRQTLAFCVSRRRREGTVTVLSLRINSLSPITTLQSVSPSGLATNHDDNDDFYNGPTRQQQDDSHQSTQDPNQTQAEQSVSVWRK